MVTAFVLIDVNRDMVPETAEALTGIDGVAEVYSVAGEWDLIAVVRVHTNEELAEVVTEHMLRLEGIENTET
ncbi:MAG: Lrp/AsnC family transcriptional regulator, partial [Planctomycetota bacterium]